MKGGKKSIEETQQDSNSTDKDKKDSEAKRNGGILG